MKTNILECSVGTYKGGESIYNKNKIKICPYCKQFIIGYPAISRRDNKTEICSNCGIIEALQILIKVQNKGCEKNIN